MLGHIYLRINVLVRLYVKYVANGRIQIHNMVYVYIFTYGAKGILACIPGIYF